MPRPASTDIARIVFGGAAWILAVWAEISMESFGFFSAIFCAGLVFAPPAVLYAVGVWALLYAIVPGYDAGDLWRRMFHVTESVIFLAACGAFLTVGVRLRRGFGAHICRLFPRAFAFVSTAVLVGLVAVVMVRGWPLLVPVKTIALVLCVQVALAGMIAPALASVRLRPGNAVLLCVSIALSLAVVEGGSRIVYGGDYEAPQVFRRAIWQPHPELIYTPKPNTTDELYLFTSENNGITWPVSISSQGVRDRVYESKREDEFRILMLGDSFTFGYGLSLDESIPKRLETRLQSHAELPPVSVINGGVVGYAPWQERGFLHEVGLGFDPDMVILQVYAANDVDGSLDEVGKYLRVYQTYWKQTLRRRRYAQSWPFRLERWMQANAYAYRIVREHYPDWKSLPELLLRLRFVPSGDVPRLPPRWEGSHRIETNRRDEYPELREAWDRFANSIAAIAQDCEERGIAFLAIAIPEKEVVSDHWWDREIRHAPDAEAFDRGKSVTRTRELLEREKIPYVPIFDAIMAHPNREKLYFEYDDHVTAEGADFIAALLEAHLLDRYEACQAKSPEKGN